MSKILKIQGTIEPNMLEDLALQIEEQAIEAEDDVDVLFDSCGGAVDVAFSIADVFEQMQESGINMRAIAEGKVYSSTIVPFLSISNRVALKGSSFLVHKATYDNLTNIDKDQLRELQNELESYTDILYDFYDDHGISREVRTYLKQGDGITIDKPNDMIDAGFISKVINERARIYNRLMRGLDRLFPSLPNFSYIINTQQIQQNIMTNKQIKALVVEGLKEAMPEIVKGVASVIKNEMIPDTDDEPMNEAVAMSPEKLGKLEGVMFETPATVEGSDEVKYLAHPTKAVEQDHFVVPIAENGSVVKLPEGDHTVTVDGKQYTIHSTGDEWYIHNAGPANKEPDTDQVPSTESEPTNEEPETNPEKKEGEETDVEDNAKPVNKKTQTAMPKPDTLKVPVANKNSYAKKMHSMFAGYGPGCVGNKD